MKNLIVCEHPGEELISFGNLILNRKQEQFDIVSVFVHPTVSEYTAAKKIFFDCCNELRIKRKTLFPLPYYKNTSITYETILSYMNSYPINDYDKVYTYSVQDGNKNKQLISSIVGSLTDTVWTLSNSGFMDEVIVSDLDMFSKRAEMISKYYSDLLINHHFAINGFCSVDTYQKNKGNRLYRYYNGCLNWRINQFMYAHPWELESSSYEQKRYRLELEALKQIEWESIIEIGGCEGYFTQMIIETFPNKKVISIEPDRNFYHKLKKRIGDKAQTINTDLKAAAKCNVDVVFISNVLYYCSVPPMEVLQFDAKYFLVSHDLHYHEQVLDKIFLSKDYICIYENELAACIENMEGLSSVKYGTNIKIWAKNGESSEREY